MHGQMETLETRRLSLEAEFANSESRHECEVSTRVGLRLSNSIQYFPVHGVVFGSFALLEAEGIVPGFQNVAVMRDAIEQRRGHFGITEHGDPFREGRVRDDGQDVFS